MSYGHYFMYPTNSTSTSSSSRQYPPSWHQTWANNQYLNNNYYLQYQNQYRYRWPANYAAYNYSPYNVYDYSSNSNNNYTENYYPKIKNPKSTVSINTKSSSIRPIKKVKYERRIETPSKKLEKSSQKKPSNSSSKKHSGYLVRHDSSKTNKKIDEQKNKENIKMQLISQLTNQTQIELNKLIEMKNKRRQITYLGIVTANPSDYVKKYGKDLIELPKTQELMHDTAAFNIEPVKNRPQIELKLEEKNLTNIEVEPSLSSNSLVSTRNLNPPINQITNNNEKTYKLAVDENGQFSLKAI